MTAREFVEKFAFDPSTFQFDQFKEKLLAELTGDDDLTTAKITKLTDENTAYDASTKDLKIRLFDATIAKQGTPVTPNDSPTAGAAGASTAPVVPESDVFK